MDDRNAMQAGKNLVGLDVLGAVEPVGIEVASHSDRSYSIDKILGGSRLLNESIHHVCQVGQVQEREQRNYGNCEAVAFDFFQANEDECSSEDHQEHANVHHDEPV